MYIYCNAWENHDMTSSKVTPSKVIIGRILLKKWCFFRNPMSNIWQYSSWKDAIRKEKERSFKQCCHWKSASFLRCFTFLQSVSLVKTSWDILLRGWNPTLFELGNPFAQSKSMFLNPKVGPKTSCLCRVIYNNSIYRGEINPSETHWFVIVGETNTSIFVLLVKNRAHENCCPPKPTNQSQGS